MSPTEISLLVTHRSTVLALDKIAKQYFNLSPAEARRRAALNQLPIKPFRLVESQKAPLFVRTMDLAAYIDAKAEEAAASLANSN